MSADVAHKLDQQPPVIPADEASDDEDDAPPPAAADVSAAGAAGADKKKKKKKKKTAAQKAAAAAAAAEPATSAAGQAQQAQQAGQRKKQTDPPSVPVMEVWGGVPPVGRLMEYHQDFNAKRSTDEEQRNLERLKSNIYEDYRTAAEVHKTVRQWARTWIKPGVPMIDIVDRIEGAVKKLVPAGTLAGGIAFPVGLSCNHIAAHWTPNPGDKTVLQAGDVLKVDIGVHVNGRIVDSAFTLAWDHKFDKLLEAVKAATEAGVKAAGIDVRLCDVGSEIQEVMESYEVELNGRMVGVKPIRNLYGHSVGPYQVHAGKSVPIVRGGEGTRMEEGDCFAIETFGSTGRGFVQDGPDCSHYMRNYEDVPVTSRVARTRELYNHITRNHGTLAWSRRHIDNEGFAKYQLPLKALVDCGAVNPYPPLVDERGSYVAQFEHTVCLKPTCKEVFSMSSDY